MLRVGRNNASMRPRGESTLLPLAIARTVLGVGFIVLGAVMIANHPLFATLFARWHLPQESVMVPVVGAVQIVCGALFALGALTRPAGLVLAAVMLATLLSAGRLEGGLYLIAPALLFLVLLFYSWRSGRFAAPSPSRRPGTQ